MGDCSLKKVADRLVGHIVSLQSLEPSCLISTDDIYFKLTTLLGLDVEHRKLTNSAVVHAFLQNVLQHQLNELLNRISFLSDEEKSTSAQNQKGSQKSPPKLLLSINHLRAVYTSLELLWFWGVKPCIQSHVSIEYSEEFPKAMMLSKNVIESVATDLIEQPIIESILKYICTLSLVSQCPLFSSQMLKRYLPKILIALMTLSGRCQSISVSHSIGERANEYLQNICSSEFEHVVVSCLRFPNRGPPWMVQMVSETMSRILIGKDGLQCTLVGYLEG